MEKIISRIRKYEDISFEEYILLYEKYRNRMKKYAKDKAYNLVDRWEYSSIDSNLDNGFYDLNIFNGFFVGGYKRGRIIKNINKAQKASFRYGFDSDNKLVFAEQSRDDFSEYLSTMDEQLSKISVRKYYFYENNRIVIVSFNSIGRINAVSDIHLYIYEFDSATRITKSIAIELYDEVYNIVIDEYFYCESYFQINNSVSYVKVDGEASYRIQSYEFCANLDKLKDLPVEDREYSAVEQLIYLTSSGGFVDCNDVYPHTTVVVGKYASDRIIEQYGMFFFHDNAKKIKIDVNENSIKGNLKFDGHNPCFDMSVYGM